MHKNRVRCLPRLSDQRERNKKNSHESIANVPKIEVINSITQIACREREFILYVYIIAILFVSLFLPL